MRCTPDAAPRDYPEVSEAHCTRTASAERGHPGPSDGVSPLLSFFREAFWSMCYPKEGINIASVGSASPLVRQDNRMVNDGAVERVSELGCKVTERIYEEPAPYSRWLQRKYTEPDNSFLQTDNNQ